MASTTSTIPALKSSFLLAQTRILSQPLQPSQRFLNTNSELPASAVKDAVRETNRLLRRHAKAVYSSLAVRHVAEQIDRLYWTSAAPDAKSDEGDEGLREGDDLTDSETIKGLPEEWDGEVEEGAEGMEESYVAAAEELQALAERRDALRKKVETYRRLQQLLQPFKGPLNTVQPNLVTRDGELAAELSRCRTLGIRIGGRLADPAAINAFDENSNIQDPRTEEYDLGVSNEEKLAHVQSM